jgi:hypothetical protein
VLQADASAHKLKIKCRAVVMTPFGADVIRYRSRASSQPWGRSSYDPEARWASWQRARQAGVLSPNDVRIEEGWPASDDPTADSIMPPVAGGRAANGDDAGSSSASPGEPASSSNDDHGEKVARFDQHRHKAVPS